MEPTQPWFPSLTQPWGSERVDLPFKKCSFTPGCPNLLDALATSCKECGGGVDTSALVIDQPSKRGRQAFQQCLFTPNCNNILDPGSESCNKCGGGGPGQIAQQKKRRERLWSMQQCPFTAGCNNTIGKAATKCNRCGGGVENQRGRAKKRCPKCSQLVSANAHKCSTKGCDHEWPYHGNTCPVCSKANHQNARFCKWCPGKTELRSPRENKKPCVRVPRQRQAYKPDALKPGTVIRAVPEGHVYSVRGYASGQAFRCACIWEPEKDGSTEPPRRACNREDCRKLAEFNKGVGLSMNASPENKRGEAASQIEGRESELLLCSHLRLVKEALETEEADAVAVESPVARLGLKKAVLDSLMKSNLISEDRSKQLLEVAMAFKQVNPATEDVHCGVSSRVQQGQQAERSSHSSPDGEHVEEARCNAQDGAMSVAEGDDDLCDVMLVTDSYLLLPVLGRTSAVGYGHVSLNRTTGSMACHVAKGAACSEFSKRERKGAKYCFHTQMAFWAIRSQLDFLPRILQGRMPLTSITSASQSDTSLVGTDLQGPLLPLTQEASTGPNEWGALKQGKQLQILYLMCTTAIPSVLPVELSRRLDSLHLCHSACASSCSSAWPRSFRSQLQFCFWCESALDTVKGFDDVVLLDVSGIFFDRSIEVQICNNCDTAFAPNDWQSSGCGVPFCNKMVLSLPLLSWIRELDARGLAPMSSVRALFERVRHQVPPGKRLPSVFDVAQAYWANEGLVDHGYSFSCAIHGCAPPIVAADGNEKHRFDMREKIVVDTSRERIIDVAAFWSYIDISIVSPLILGKRLAILDQTTVEQLGGFAPWSCPGNSADDEARFWIRSAREDKVPRGDPRDGDFEAVNKQLDVDNITWSDLSAVKHEKLKQLHKLAYGIASAANKAQIASRLQTLQQYHSSKQGESGHETSCSKYFPAFNGTTAGITKGMCTCGVTVFLAVNLDAESPQDIKDMLYNFKYFPDVVVYDHICKGLLGANREHPKAFPTAGKIPSPSRDPHASRLAHLDHVSPAFACKPNASTEPSPPSGTAFESLVSAAAVECSMIGRAAGLLTNATRNKRNTAFVELIAKSLDPSELPIKRNAETLVPEGSSRSALKEGPILADGQRRKHPYTGNQQEVLGITSTSHITNHTEDCRKNRDPDLLGEAFKGLNLEGPEQAWSRESMHLSSDTGMGLEQFFFAARLRTHVENCRRNDESKKTIRSAALSQVSWRNLEQADFGEDEYGRATLRFNEGQEKDSQLGQEEVSPLLVTSPAAQRSSSNDGGLDSFGRPVLPSFVPHGNEITSLQSSFFSAGLSDGAASWRHEGASRDVISTGQLRIEVPHVREVESPRRGQSLATSPQEGAAPETRLILGQLASIPWRGEQSTQLPSWRHAPSRSPSAGSPRRDFFSVGLSDKADRWRS